jgi:hypothetical protein
MSMVFSPDNSRLVSVGGNESRTYKDPLPPGMVQLWDIATGQEIRTFIGHEDVVYCVAITADGRMLATGGCDKTLRLWEVASGKQRRRIIGHESGVGSVDFSPDGKLLAACSSDAPVYLWDVYRTQKPVSPGDQLGKEDLEKLWQKLADIDGSLAFQAMCELIARPSQTVALLQGKWKYLPRATPQQMHKWVTDLSNDQFTVRKTATAQLERFAAQHEVLLREAFKELGSLEARRRLERILAHIDQDHLRRLRMLEVLEQLRNAPARQFLQVLAEQGDDPYLSRGATASLKRLEQQR